MEVSSGSVVCYKCGAKYKKHQGNFAASHSSSHKGVGYIPICKSCIETMYTQYLNQCNNTKDTIRQVCRKLDVYWNEDLYKLCIENRNSYPLIFQYIQRVAGIKYAGKSYDDSLSFEGTLWRFDKHGANKTIPTESVFNDELEIVDYDDMPPIPDEWITFWGSGYSADMYCELEKRREYYYSKLSVSGNLDVGTEALIRQICNLEVSIAKDSAAGKSIDKSVNSLNNLIGSLNLKPAQKKNEELETELANTPLGVWLQRYETKRPLPEIDEELKDSNKIKKYVFTWMGHLGKMLGIKNSYTKMYEDEINRLKVDKPEYDGDEEDLIIDSYSETPSVKEGGLNK